MLQQIQSYYPALQLCSTAIIEEMVFMVVVSELQGCGQGRNFHLKRWGTKIVPAARIVRAAGLRKCLKFSVQNGAFFSHIFFS